MKGKIPKILGVGLALILVLSLSLVTAVPVAAAAPVLTPNLIPYGNGGAEWATGQLKPGSEPYSVLLDAGIAGGANAGRIQIDLATPIAIADFTGASFFVWEPTGTEHGGVYPGGDPSDPYGDPYINILLDLNGDGTVYDKLEGYGSIEYGTTQRPTTHPTPELNTWVQMEEGYGFYDMDDSIGQGTWIAWPIVVGTLAEWKAWLVANEPLCEVVGVQITFGFWAAEVTPDVYVDDVEVSGTTYDLEPTAQEPIDLGTAANYAVLAGSAVTNTGPTVVIGDLGLSPGSAITGFFGTTANDGPGVVIGAIEQTTTAAAEAQADLTAAYLDAAGRTADVTGTELGGTTKTPGAYSTASGELGITGTLTLDAGGDEDAVFIFQAGSTLTTATGSVVELINDAQASNVFWQVGSSATLGTNSTFSGTILALTAITVESDSTLEGRALAQNAAVTFSGACTITVPDLEGPIIVLTPAEGVPLTEVMVNGYGFTGTETVNIYFDGAFVETSASCANGVMPATTFDVPAGTTVGTHVVDVAGVTSGIVASATFTVPTPYIDLSVALGPPGTTVTVTGGGFTKSDLVKIYFGTDIAYIKAVVATVAGAIPTATTFTVPDKIAGDYTVKAKEGSIEKATHSFTISTPSITLDPTSGPKETPVLVTGENFKLGATVTITGFDGALSDTDTADGSGAFTYTFNVPDVLADVYTVSATDEVNTAEAVPFTVTTAAKFNVDISPTEIAAASPSTVAVTFSDVDGDGPDGILTAEPLNTVKVSLSGPGVDLESGDFDGIGDTSGDATGCTPTTMTFAVTPEQAGTITVTFVGTFDDESVVTKTLDISVTGFLVEEAWANVDLGTTGDISMTVTTKAGATVPTGIVTITAPEPAGFEKDVNDDGELESFTTIIIDGSAGQITYGGGNAEDFVVMDGYYEVTGIKFAEVGPVGILVENAASAAKADFPTAFTVLGVDVYEVLPDPDTVTAGVETNVAVTVTEDGDPVTEIDSIKVADQTFESLSSADGVYEITLEPIPEAGTPVVTVTGETGQKYGSTDLAVALPAVDYTIYDGEEERNVMLVGAAYDYTIAVTVTDALGELLDSGNVWLGTYEEEIFEALTGVTTSLPAAIEDGLGEIAIAQDGTDLLTAGRLVWKVGSGGDINDAALILDLDQAITVEDPAYHLDYETPVIAGQSLTVSVRDNYEDLQKYMGVIVRNPDSTIDSFSTGYTGAFAFTPAVVGDYEVYSGPVSGATFIETITVAPAEFTLANLVVTPPSGVAPLEITASAEVTNIGGVAGDYTAELKVNDAVEDSQVVTVAARATETVTFADYELSDAGTYQVTIDELTAVEVTVSEPIVILETIAASPESVTLDVDDTQQLTVTATYSDATTPDVTADSNYESSDPLVATVSEAGLITGVAVGDATVTVAFDTETTTVSVTVRFDPMVYDADGDGVISKSEALTAVADYFNGDITKAQALLVIVEYMG